MSKTWKKVSEKLVLSHPRLKAYVDTAKLPSGHIVDDYLRFIIPTAASVIAVNDNGKILVQKEYSYPPNKWLYQFPGGAVEPNEDPADGARRELNEEAGITAKHLQPIGSFYQNNRRSNSKFYIYVGTDLEDISSKKLPSDTEEVFETYWFTKAEIDYMIAQGEISTQSFLASWALFKASPTTETL